MYERSEPLLTINPAPAEPGRGIFVFGAPRGGTSMVAGALRLLGVDMGARQGQGNNEDLDIQDARGPVGELADPTSPDLAAALDRMRPVIAKRGQSAEPWGWKDPHGAFYAPHIEADLPAPRLIAVFRDPQAAAQRVHMLTDRLLIDALDDTLKLYERCSQCLAASRQPAAMVSYEKTLVRPELFVEQLVAFCGLSPEREQVEAAIAFCYPERGHGSPTDPGWPNQGAL
ncbi:sulfotransferase [Hyphobacterium sp.]|uniref:sulfotransferase n=1 Tax=Hyphobacterium sp. TaxID=2004662 RepID=UPI003B51649E